MSDAQPRALAAYGAVTAAYWAFMLSDGALRMLVLLHFHTLGFSALQLAWLFLLYEFMGMVTNLSAGWLAARFGLTSTLYAGLGIQIVALAALAQLDPAWGLGASVAYVMAVQGASGVAKDLAKMSSKSAVKLLAPKGDGALFRWVAVLTGSKNAVKGLGFLLGTVLLGALGFTASVWAMAAVLAVILAGVALFMPPGLPQGKKGAKFTEVFSKDPAINRLSAARLFLFGARDVWFVVGIPIYFYAVLSDGSEAGNRAAFFQIGTFMALWIIAYGVVQASAPKLLGAKSKPLGQISRMATRWVAGLTVIPLALAGLSLMADGPQGWLTGALIAGLMVFGFVFAVNSSLHSYLILALTSAERVTMDVGFYYMSNAAGRLVGTLLSGLSYQIGGLPLCLATAGAMAGLSAICIRGLRPADQSAVT
ncbi:organoarsenical effux MFS transporter ArsJ [Actibacterium sp. XHP0104]|uniref:organoarsenical effux MFS transporter ArsJ n=1 Tax=Actibacterium sp. XHP0104 TaxID=2984335 RepID=UPI0021E7FC17|nr:organoarsenical effux MFS transporter ArsJ [Actibacterium sp. XHP0104]MCV2881433.1 organoarsenical effux MFS transporter ArsJ [Actibacterium sp. XHP0104]